VVIAFVGSVFSPYYARALRRGAADPEQHCAVNVALYGKGGHHWAMTERTGAVLQRDADRFSLGPSSLRWDGRSLHIAVNERTMPFMGRIAGEIVLTPEAVLGQSFALDASGHHVWRPIAPSARVSVRMDAPGQSWQGRGYLDTNTGSRPIAEDFTYWDWARGDTSAGAMIHYDVLRRDGTRLDLSLIARGDRLEPVEAPAPVALRRTNWLIGRNARCDAGTRPHVALTLEDTPFYTRSIVKSRIGGEPVTLMHESLDLDRLRRRWVETLLPFRMPRRS
jgi:carotenoid 1,2-hydratase